jgi:hypothetical protein
LSGIELPGPVTIEIEARATRPLRLAPSWRTSTKTREFIAAPESVLAIPGNNEWQTLRGNLRADPKSSICV